MADFNNLALTTNGINALLAAQAGTTLTLSKIGMGSGSTNSVTHLENLVIPEVMLPITEKRIDEESGFMSIVAKMTNKDISEGFYWRETGLFFEDAEGNDVLFAYACVIDDQYDYVPAYSDKRYVKHVRIANIVTDSADIEIKEQRGLLYVDTLTFEEYKEFVNSELTSLKARPVNNNLIVNSNFANPVNQRNVLSVGEENSAYTIDRWRGFNVVLLLNKDYTTLKANNPANPQTFMTQYVEFPGKYRGKALTASIRYRLRGAGEATIGIGYYSTFDEVVLENDGEWHTAEVSCVFNLDVLSYRIKLSRNIEMDVEWVKMEEGNAATPYVASLYIDETLRCGVPDDSSEFGFKEYCYKLPINNNLLINSNFANPVNQRGKSVYSSTSTNLYTIDRWLLMGGTLTISDDSIVLASNGSNNNRCVLRQRLDIPLSELRGKSISISFETSEGVFSYTEKLPATLGDTGYDSAGYEFSGSVVQYVDVVAPINENHLALRFVSTGTLTLKWVKLEIGEVATHYVPRLYEEELLLCQRYYQEVYVRNSYMYYLSANSIRFAISFPPMRAKPTIDLSGLSVYKNADIQTEFIPEIITSNKQMARISFNKIAHGFTSADCLSIGVSAILDAEL